jgi:hypothetical protein
VPTGLSRGEQRQASAPSAEAKGAFRSGTGPSTIALRVEVSSYSSGDQTVVLDLVAVGVGHNVVTFMAAGLNPLPTPQLEQIARAGVAKMVKVSESS